MAEVLIRFLSDLSVPVIPPTCLVNLEVDDSNIIAMSRALLEQMPPIHYNVFIYLMSFWREVLLYHQSNRVTAAKLARLCYQCMVLGSSYKATSDEPKNSVTRRAGLQLIIDHFLTATHI